MRAAVLVLPHVQALCTVEAQVYTSYMLLLVCMLVEAVAGRARAAE